MKPDPLSMGNSRRWLFARVVLLIIANFAIPCWLLAALAYLYAPHDTIWGWLFLSVGLAGGWVSFVNTSSQALATSVRHWVGLETLKTLNAFERVTTRALKGVKDTLPTLDRLSRREVIDTWTSILAGESVRIVGPSGTGKSGIVGAVARLATANQMPVLLLNASYFTTSVSTSENLDRYVEVTQPLRNCVEDLVKVIGGCLIIVDQLDNVAGHPSFEVLKETLAFTSIIRGACAIVASTSFDDANYRSINVLNWKLIESRPLDEQRVAALLARLNISNPSMALQALSQNLLYLSLVAELSAEIDLGNVTGAVTLLDEYRKALEKSYGSQLVDLAIDVAHPSVEDSTRDIYANRANRGAIQILVKRNLLVATATGSVRFRHEQLLYYFYALGAVEQHEAIGRILEQLAGNYTPSALVWVLRLLHQRRARDLEEYLREALFQPSRLGFYEQAALLDEILTWSNISEQSSVVAVVVNALRPRTELRTYFFRRNPSAEWALILWEHGFFDSPPPPEKTVQGFALPPWDVQYYLTSVAQHVPEIVIKHVESISGHGWYISHALKALCRIPADQAERVIPRVLDWLHQPDIVEQISDEASELMGIMTKDGKTASALGIFQALTAPEVAPKGEQRRRPDRYTVLDHALGDRHERSEGYDLLKKTATESVITILENHLINGQRIDAEAEGRPDLEFYAGWRSAIEDTDQDILDTYNARVLRAFRDTVEVLVSANPNAGKPLIERYLADRHSILRRLGLFVISKYPQLYNDLVERELFKSGNIDNTDIHHEYFVLLKQGFPILNQNSQGLLVNQILDGPDDQKTEKLAEWVVKQYGENKEAYIDTHRKVWIRNRLWMIRDHLGNVGKALLKDLIAERGTPEHPDFLAWNTGAFWVRDISPFDEQELGQLDPDELIRRVASYQPNPQQRFGPEQESYEGLANTLANVVIANPIRYAPYLIDIVSIRPEFASALLNRWSKPEDTTPVPWEMAMQVSEGLLGQGEIWAVQPRLAFEESWLSVRLAIVRLLEIGMSNNHRKIPIEYLDRAGNLLLKLIDDPDPSLESDRPKEGWAGHDDPVTVALNHVRPTALSALIKYALRRADESRDASKTEETIPDRLEPAVRHALTRKLDKTLDPSRAVHSIFGQYLRNLYWLDQEWVRSNLDRIFPPSAEDESAWFFAAAWDAFVLSSYPAYLQALLRPYYLQAIASMSAGYISKTYLPIARNFAIHIALEYMLGDYDLGSSIGQHSLLVEFFKKVPVEKRPDIPWALGRICEDHLDRRQGFWLRAKAVWDWRNRVSVVSNHSPDFNEEMEEFAQLLLVVPETETFATLRPLLEGLLPHIGRFEYRNRGWDALEKYLVRQVERDSLGAIQLYRQMYDQRTSPPRWHFHSEESRKIVEMAAANLNSRLETLALIDMLARWGDREFRDIYERYAS